MEAFTENIEKVIIEKFQDAEKSIVIVVAWFTNPEIIECLIEIKRFKEIEIEILVDDNQINQKYFVERFENLLIQEGIKVRKQEEKEFIHHKFAILDEKIVITGSYNYSKRANRNKENIVILENEKIASFFKRILIFFTTENYIDENIKLLYENFDFANKIISTYYPFKKKILDKIKNKIEIGTCYTYPNGIYDEIHYEPGLIFNPKYFHHKELKKQEKYKNSFELIGSKYSQEFPLPIKKETIIHFQAEEINNFSLSILHERTQFDSNEIDYNGFIEDSRKNELAIKAFYKRKFQQTFSKVELENLIKKDIDLIKENQLWFNNFLPFLNDSILLDLYN